MEGKSIANLGRVVEAHRHFLAGSLVHHSVSTLRPYSHRLLHRQSWREGARANPPALPRRLPLGLALGCDRTTYHRHLRFMHQERPGPESHFVIPACLWTDIHLLPVFECGKFCDGSGPAGGEAGPLGERKCPQLLHTRTAGNGEKSNSHGGRRTDSSSRHYAASITTTSLSPSSRQLLHARQKRPARDV